MYLKRYIFLQQPRNDRRVTGDGNTLHSRHSSDAGRKGFFAGCAAENRPRAGQRNVRRGGWPAIFFLISNNDYQ